MKRKLYVSRATLWAIVFCTPGETRTEPETLWFDVTFAL